MSVNSEPLKPYKKGFDYSYTLGAFPTMELINKKTEQIICIYVSSKYDGSIDFFKICKEKNIRCEYNDKLLNRISTKENCFVAGAFYKFDCELKKDTPHVVLVNISDMGNLGTIIRTLAGFGICDLAIIAPCADVYNPKTIRASMGALFSIRIHVFDSFEEYERSYGDREMYPFMLNGDKTLNIYDCKHSKVYSLIFGNEATGLPDYFKNVGQSIFIPQTELVDSLNLPISVGVGSFVFKNSINE